MEDEGGVLALLDMEEVGIEHMCIGIIKFGDE